ncbi:MAG: hypothetical protein ACOYJD_02265 [Christensenellales bacterium]
MTDYKRMYFELFNSLTDVIAALQQAQQKAETLYIEASEPAIRLVERRAAPKSNSKTAPKTRSFYC